MSGHLLRLAKLLKDHLEGDRLWIEVRDDVRSLVNDIERAPLTKSDEAENRRAADLLISHFGGHSLPDAVEKAVTLRYMKREQGIVPPGEMMTPPPVRHMVTRSDYERALVAIDRANADGWATAKHMVDMCAAAWGIDVEQPHD